MDLTFAALPVVPKCRSKTDVQWTRALPAVKKSAFGVITVFLVSFLFSSNNEVLVQASVERGSVVPPWLMVGDFGSPWTKTEQPLIAAVKKMSESGRAGRAGNGGNPPGTAGRGGSL